MSLFSDSPQALLFALEQSLRGAMAALVRSDPQGLSNETTDPRDYLLLFAVDKSLPKDIMAEATRLFRDVPIPHVGVLSCPIPGSLLPPEAVSDSKDTAARTDLPSSYHNISLSLLPLSMVKPFYSEIKGVAPVKAGRWATGKPSFDDNSSRIQSLLQGKDDNSNEESTLDWRSSWGKENKEGLLPPDFDHLKSENHLLTLLVGSDSAPQGLLEGLEMKYGPSPILGSIASNTFFETGGRERTMFYRGLPELGDTKTSKKKKKVGEEDGPPAAEAKIFDKGAVGLTFISPANIDATSNRARPRVDVEVPWKYLLPLGEGKGSTTRRKVTRAKGNIVSELDGGNACQFFLRDVAKRDKSRLPSSEEEISPEVKARTMNVEEQRILSSSVKKEEEFWAVIWARGQPDSNEKPLLVSRILSGHPGRGTVSLDTDLELDAGLENSNDAEGEFYLEFYQNTQPEGASSDLVEAIPIPGEDLAAWRLPRFLFLNTQETSQQAASVDSNKSKDKKKPAVHALPNLFVLGSEAGFVSRDPSLFSSSTSTPKEGQAAISEILSPSSSEGKSGLRNLQERTTTLKMLGGRGWVDLRGRS